MSNEELQFDQFERSVRENWPKARWGTEELAAVWSSLKRHGIDAVVHAVKQERLRDLDATRPSWKLISKTLFQQNKGCERKSDFRVLIDNTRRLLIKANYPGARDMTDRDVWQNYLDANTRPITHHPFKQTVLEDETGRLAKTASELRRMIAHKYIDELQDRGETIPSWMAV